MSDKQGASEFVVTELIVNVCIECPFFGRRQTGHCKLEDKSMSLRETKPDWCGVVKVQIFKKMS